MADGISKWERKYGRFAIQNLPVVILVAYALGFVIHLIAPSLYTNWLSLDAGRILKGQIWRIVTFIIQPPSSSPIWVLIALYFYYVISTALNRAWGAFRFNLYFFAGVLFHVLGALLAYFITWAATGMGISFLLSTEYLNLSMFFAFAALYPETRFLLFFIIPVKVKYLAYIDAAFFLYTIGRGLLPAAVTHTSGAQHLADLALAIAAIVSLLNFLIFFLATRKKTRGQAGSARKRVVYTQRADRTSPRPESGVVSRHRCSICGRTELTNPELEFRYCSKCKGAHEYCQDHLFTHMHIQ